MERVDRFLVRHRRSVLVAWTLAVLAAVPFSPDGLIYTGTWVVDTGPTVVWHWDFHGETM